MNYLKLTITAAKKNCVGLTKISLVCCAGLGDDWGHRVVNTTSREKELGSQILQVVLSLSSVSVVVLPRTI